MNQSRGFTMVELIVVTALTALLSAVILQFGLSYIRYGAIVQSDSSAFVERLNVSDYFREHVGLSTGLVSDNSISDPHTLVPGADASHWREMYPVSNSTYGTPSAITPILYFKEFSRDANRALIPLGASTYYEDEYIVYHDGPKGALRVRILANPAAPGNARLTTCPDANASAACPADSTLITGISSVRLRYFSRAGNELSITNNCVDEFGNPILPIPTYPYTGCNGASFSIVEVVELVINLEKQPLGTHAVTTKSATIIRVALRNK